MITSQAPTRISLFGGGTDIPNFYVKYGGAVLSMAINVRQSMVLDDDNHYYSIPINADKKFYDAFFNDVGYKPKGFSSFFDEDIHSGLGSSASAAVALVSALAKRFDLDFNRETIAETAWKIEVDKLGMFGGKQDQYAASFGGLNVFQFLANSVEINTLNRDLAEELSDHMVLVKTGVTRKSKNIQEGLREPDSKQIKHLKKLKAMVLEGTKLLVDRDFKGIGLLLDKAWQTKKKTNKGITNNEINKCYNKGIKAGAWGGKLLGSGGGGYMVFLVENKDEFDIDLEKVDFSVDYQGVDVRKK